MMSLKTPEDQLDTLWRELIEAEMSLSQAIDRNRRVGEAHDLVGRTAHRIGEAPVNGPKARAYKIAVHWLSQGFIDPIKAEPGIKGDYLTNGAHAGLVWIYQEAVGEIGFDPFQQLRAAVKPGKVAA